MKKLVIFVDSLKRDGAERVSVNLAKYMSKNGIKTILVTEWISDGEYDVPDGVERISLDAHGNKYAGYFKNILKLRKVLKTIKPDVLLVMDLPGCLLAIPASKGLRMKIVVSERNDPTHFPGKKIVANISRRLMARADGFVFQTEDAKSFYNKLVKGRGVIIPNPVFVEDLPDPYVGNREKIIVTAGRLTRQKNQKLLIDAFAKFNIELKGYILMIYGEGELKDELLSQAQSLGISDNVYLPGNKKNLLERIKKASMFVMTSSFEGMPNALLEAMAIGLPVISTNCPCGGPKAVINDMNNGMLIPLDDSEACKNAMRKIAEDIAFSNKLANNAIKIREKLDSNIIAKEWKDYLTFVSNLNV
jgi:glycosyltransferase involved in cell wall biosynthesis